jgi:hypothetical protein
MQTVAEATELKECMVCHHFNSNNATVCQECSMPLYSGDETLHSRAGLRNLAYTENFTNTLELNEKRVVLYTPTDRQYVEIVEQSEVVFGRENSDQATVMIDLTPYSGHVLGVSRQHANITYHDGTYWVMDLESRYGSYLNDRPLSAHSAYELRNGDLLRLGDFQMKVQFSRRSMATY